MAVTVSQIPPKAEVVVIGGGAAGVCCAHALASHGHDVLLVERDSLCAGSSYGNAALIPPSRALPLGAPGVIAKSLRSLVDPHGPFRLRFRTDPDLARWLAFFRRSCSAEASGHSAVILRDLIRESLEIYEELANSGLEFGFRKAGLLELFRTQDGLAAAEAEARRLADIDIHTILLDQADIRRHVSQADDSVLGALFAPEDAHINPAVFVSEMAARAHEKGAIIEASAQALRLVRDGSRVRGVETSRGTVTAETVVLANGAWAATLGRALGMRLLIEPAKGYSFGLAVDSGSLIEHPLLLNEIRTTVTPIGDMLRVTAKLDLVGFDRSMDSRRVSAIPESTRRYLRIGSYKVTEAWSGFRPLTPDGLPLIGRPRAFTNLILAAGGGRMGVALAPLTGRLVTQVTEGRAEHALLPHLRPDRFQPV